MEELGLRKRVGFCSCCCGNQCKVRRSELCICLAILVAVVGVGLWFAHGFSQGMQKSSVPLTDKMSTNFAFKKVYDEIQNDIDFTD